MVPFTAWPCLKAVTVCLSESLMSVWSVHTSKLIWLWLHHLLYRVYESSLKETWSKVNRSLLVYMWILWASSVSAQTFEPFVCRADHGISLFPVKLNHPARGKKRTVWFPVGNVTGSKSVQVKLVRQEVTYLSMCWRKPSCPQLCNNWDTMSWKKAGHSDYILASLQIIWL